MIRILCTILITLSLTNCVKNQQLKKVITDLQSTPQCNSDVVMVYPNDTKETLTARMIVLNYKLNCFDNYQFMIMSKLKKYKDL